MPRRSFLLRIQKSKNYGSLNQLNPFTFIFNQQVTMRENN